jgi:hypothetical protein
MVEKTFSITSAWSVQPPCYLRKVDRSGHWQDAAAIRDKVFCPEPPDNTVSVYLVNSARDVARVAVALNANRSSKTEPIFLVAIAADELGDLPIRQTRGQTLCRWANHLHHDLIVFDAGQLGGLVQRLLAAERKPKKFTKNAMQEALEDAFWEGCYAANPQSDDCSCEQELRVLMRSGLFSRLIQSLNETLRRMANRFGMGDGS